MQLTGKGAMTNRSLLVITYPNSVTKNGKTQYADVQLNADEPDAAGKTDLHVSSVRKTLPENVAAKLGKKFDWVNTQPYSMSQLDAIKEAAGDNFVVAPKADGTPGPTVYSVTASLMPVKSGGLIINVKKPMGPGPEIDTDVLSKQFKSMQLAKEAKAKEAAVEKEAEVEIEAEAPAVEENEIQETLFA